MVRRIVRDYYATTREFTPNARLFLIATVLSWSGLAVNQVVFNLYLVAAGYSAEFIGGVTAMQAVGMAALALPAGWLADRMGRRATLLAGAAGIALALAIRALSLSPQALFASTFGLGAGQALITISTSPFLTENSNDLERTHLFSMHFVVILLGGLLGNLLGGEFPGLVGQAVPALAGSPLPALRWTLIAGAAASLLAVVPLYGLAEAPHVTQDPARRVRARDHVPLLGKLGFNFLLVGMGAGLIMPYFNLYFANRFGATTSQIGIYFSVAQVITLIATLTGPLLARRFGKLEALSWLQLASLPFLVTLGFERTLALAVLAYWARSALMQMSSPLLNSFAMDSIPPALRARAVGIDNLCWWAGWAVSSALAGWVIERFGYAYPYYLTALFYGLATVTFWFNFRKAARPA
jgi:MFS family permease